MDEKDLTATPETETSEPETAEVEAPVEAAEAPADETAALTPLLESISGAVTAAGESLAAMSARLETLYRENHELHRKVHTDFSDRARAMEEELAQYRERDRGRAFDAPLAEIALLYSENADILRDEALCRTLPQLAKRLENLFADIRQLLEGSDVTLQQSREGDKRSARFCRVLERVPTPDPALHDTVARSRKPGFYRENRPLVKEMIDVYVYTPAEPEAQLTENEN